MQVAKRLIVGLSGALLGLLAWAVFIAITNGMCAVPGLGGTWCTSGGGGSLRLWDLVVLVAAIGVGAKAGYDWLG